MKPTYLFTINYNILNNNNIHNNNNNNNKANYLHYTTILYN